MRVSCRFYGAFIAFFIAIAAGPALAGLPGEQFLQEQQLCEAQDTLHTMVTAIDAMDAAFQSQPEMLNDPERVQSAIAHMAQVDETARDALFHALDSSWEPEVFATFVQFFINPRPAGDEDMGYLQRLDRDHYFLLKRILTESAALGEAGWPTPPAFDAATSYQAFVLARRGLPLDPAWQQSTLIPRLMKLAEEGAVPKAAVAWYTAASPEELSMQAGALAGVETPWSGLAAQTKRTEALLNALRKNPNAELLPPLTPEPCGVQKFTVEPAPSSGNGTQAGRQ